ncbi:MAG: amidohydrolase, partial [Clostridia bacterium]|nr:amidohydrolase [Clostridia bacterium]
ELEGTVKLMFQPAEEVFGGAKDMIENGLLEEPAVDAAMMLHMMAGMPFAPGTVIVPAGGPSSPAADYFEIRVQGKGCHGSMPHNGIDPITAAAHILIALQELQARELPLGERAVLTIGTIHGGTASNAIADTAVMGGTLRAFDEDTRALLKRRMEEIAKGIASAFRAEANVVFTSGCPVLVNDPALSKQAEETLLPLLGEKCLTPKKLAAMFAGQKNSSAGGSEDFAYVGQHVPVLMLALAGGRPQDGHTWPLHHPMVTFDEAALPYGAAVHVCMAMEWLKNATDN